MDAPWWGVPVIAGCFIALGATIALASTWLSDKRKASQARKETLGKLVADILGARASLETYHRMPVISGDHEAELARQEVRYRIHEKAVHAVDTLSVLAPNRLWQAGTAYRRTLAEYDRVDSHPERFNKDYYDKVVENMAAQEAYFTLVARDVVGLYKPKEINATTDLDKLKPPRLEIEERPRSEGASSEPGKPEST